ncbi:MAG: hypothetical protein IKF99_15255 [Oscillospiraceae bacterium]|nr:hypothetical protein [Oscillospiraceae bacterium]
MARDIAKANRAIAEAWKREKELVKKGMGTRDWTSDQQKDILATGKVHDADGKAFEGHHMKCVSRYPNFQGEPDNIQFLSREEHIKAHGGKTQNQTNGYYDYLLEKTTVTFDEETLIPIEPKPLKELADEVKEIMAKSEQPVEEAKEEQDEKGKTGETSKEEFHKSEHKDSGKTTAEQIKPKQEWQEETPELTPTSVNTNTLTEQDDDDFDFDERFRDDDLEDLIDFDFSDYLGYTSHKNDGRKKKRGLFERIGDRIEDFKYEHPALSGFLMGMGQAATEFGKQYANDLIESVIDDAINSHAGGSNDSGAKHTSDAVPSVRIDIPDEDATGPKRSAPREHDVREYTRKRFGKTEIVRKHVSPKPTNDESEE